MSPDPRRNGTPARVVALPEDRLPPQNLEAEQGCLGGLILAPDWLDELAGSLAADDFYRDDHQVLFSAIWALHDRRVPVDGLTVSEELQTRHGLSQADADERVATVLQVTAHAANTGFYAAIVREKARLRALIQAANGMLRDAYGGRLTAEEALEGAERAVLAIGDREAGGAVQDLAEIVPEVADRLTRRRGNEYTGIPSGLVDLDDLLDGFQGSQLVVLAARPSMGKTALALNICEHAAYRCGVNVLFVSLEMGQLELAERMAVSRAGVDGHRVRTGRGLADADLAALRRAFAELSECGRFFLDPGPLRTASQIAAAARRAKARHGVGLVVVDYLQLIEAEAGGDRRESRQQQVATISRRLKIMAKELDIPVIALSQLNRLAEGREGHRPRMSDLRDSGAIEQDADLVLLLHRPEYYDPNDQPGIAELDLAKNRNGRTGLVRLCFRRAQVRFENLAIDVPLDL